MAIDVIDLEHLARQGPVFIMLALPCLGVVPDAGRPLERTSVRPPFRVIEIECLGEIRALSPESVPGFFTEVVEHVVVRRPRDHQATGPAPLA
jgi:hypothetical protein